MAQPLRGLLAGGVPCRCHWLRADRPEALGRVVAVQEAALLIQELLAQVFPGVEADFPEFLQVLATLMGLAQAQAQAWVWGVVWVLGPVVALAQVQGGQGMPGREAAVPAPPCGCP